MKEAEIFENYMNRLSEGTWALPDTPEAYEKLQQLMTGELIVGADAMNATEQLYDLVGDTELFDILNDLAENDPRANCWDDSDVQRRLAELGIQTPQSTQAEPANVAQDTAPAQPAPVPPVAEGQLDEIGDTPAGQAALQRYGNKAHDQVAAHWKQVHNKSHLPTDPKMAKRNSGTVAADNRIHGFGIAKNQQDKVTGRFKYRDAVGLSHVYQKNDPLEQGVAEGDNISTFVEDRELAEMLKYAGVPIKENVLTDSTGSTLEHIKDTYKRDVKDFTQSGEMSKHLYHALHDYYFDDMPYGAKTGDDIDPHEWVADRFAEDLGINENLIKPMIMPVSEGSCNMTMEGDYCPEHGLAECGGGMYEDEYIPRVEISGFGPDFEDLPAGKKLINPMQPRRHNELSPLKSGDSTPHSPVAHVDLTVDESTDDPINSNSAMTGSYYEGKETDIQEGDALLARIKSLALLR